MEADKANKSAPQEETKEKRGGGTRGQQRRGGNREGGEKREKQDKTKFVPKGEGENNAQPDQPAGEHAAHEEHKGGEEGGKRQHKEKRERKKEEITLETVIPELPKKNERLKEPNQAELDEKLDKLDQKISDLFNKKHNYIDEMRGQYRENRNKKEGVALRDVLSAKQEERKRINEEFRNVNNEHTQLKAEYDSLVSQNDKLREKLKKFFTVKEIQDEIKHLKDVLGNERLTMQEEKKLVREIDSLEASMPYAEPYEKHQKQMKECKERKDVVGKRKKELWEKLQVANKEVDNVKAELDKITNVSKEEQKELGPALNSKVDEYNADIQKLRDEKKKLIKDFNEAWHKYEDQQAFIKRVEWMQRMKQRLVREQERKKREEEWRKQEEEERKREEEANKPTGHPYKEEIALCERLIKYLKPYIPRAAPEEKKEAAPAPVHDSNKFVSKRQQDNFFIAPKQNKKPQQKPQTAEPVERKEKAQPKMNHHIEIINGFETIKMLPPLYSSEVEKVIKQVEEKREYFLAQTERPDAPAKAEGEKEKEKESPNVSPKKEKRHQHQHAVSNLDDEKEFPGLA